MDLIIIPTFDRPEFLWLCLENLCEIFKDSQNIPVIWVCEDIHADKPKNFTTEMEMLVVHREFQQKLAYDYRVTKPHTTYGNSYNVLNALLTASIYDYRYVYLVEDDVLVAPDFFAWNEAAQSKFKPWASCAGRINHSLNFERNGREAIDETSRDVNMCRRSVTAYHSWATCFPGSSLNEITAIATTDYDTFGPGLEQDILIQRFIRRTGKTTIWPQVPRAYHMGWYSYHRDGGMKVYGTLEERVKALRGIVKNQAKIKAVAGPQDIDAFPSKPFEPFTELYVK
jgi:hypothetical protein